MSEFKVGDKVLRVGDVTIDRRHLPKGVVGTITEIDHAASFWYRVEWEVDGCPHHLYYQAVDLASATPMTVAEDQTGWTGTHYDNWYTLSDQDKAIGKVKIDAYFVNKMWKLNEKDDTGGLFHNLKTIARFGDKNPVERELKALYNQTKRMAELYGVDLDE